MFLLHLMQFGPAAGGLLLAAAAWWLRRRSAPALPGRARASTASGMVLVIAAMTVFTAWSVFPWWLPPSGVDDHLFLQLARFLAPLVLTAIALLFLAVPLRRDRSTGSAELAPRTVTTFASRRRIIGTAVVVLAALATALIAGAASSADEAGRRVMFVMPISDTSSAGSTFYGWWFSVPCLVTLAVVLLIAIAALRAISQPPFSSDRSADAAERRTRAGNLLTVVTGGALLHLGVVFGSLHGTSTLRTGLDAGASGFVEFGTSFAALGSVLLIAGHAAAVLGFAAWWSVLLTAVRSGSRRRVESLAR